MLLALVWGLGLVAKPLTDFRILISPHTNVVVTENLVCMLTLSAGELIKAPVQQRCNGVLDRKAGSAEKNPARLATRLLWFIRRTEAIVAEDRLIHTRTELQDLAKQAVRYLDPFPLRKKQRPFARNPPSPKRRWIDNPTGPLKAIQSRIEQRILNRVVLPEHLLGGVAGKTITDNAERHIKARYLVTIDIKNFFPSITPHQIRAVWRKTLNCSPRVAYLLTGLTTCRGRLPQGAPTSTMLANLVLSSFDREIRAVCQLNGVAYSSWIDDLAFSGDAAHQVISPVITVLQKAGFRVSHSKIKVMGPGTRKILNNLVLGRFVTVQKEYVSRIRAGIYHLTAGHVPANDVEGYIEGLLGTISYLGLFDADKATKFRAQVQKSQA